MIWLEMSRDEAHGGPGWGFTEYLWCPTRNKRAGKWRFWQSLTDIQAGDLVFHLRGGTHEQLFVGYSIADSPAYETKDRPPIPGEWAHASSFFRVPLRDFISFADPISLDKVFRTRNSELRAYFAKNRSRRGKAKERLFYVIQSKRLQCLNGAYCSELSRELTRILFGLADLSDSPNVKGDPTSARTGKQLRQVLVRLGQAEFSDLIRTNYGRKCCFPGCDVSDRRFLVGAHIARWADAEDLRGQASNGLCLCLLHDKAFEVGLFTLSMDFKIVPNIRETTDQAWVATHIAPFSGQTILTGTVRPSEDAIRRHWKRIGFVTP